MTNKFLLNLLILIGVVCLFQSCKEGNNTGSNQRSYIEMGFHDTIYSNVLEEKRGLWIRLPEGRVPGDTLKARYPVIFLLDGDGHFFSVSGLVRQLSRSNSIIPEMIIVGIPNTDRTRDLTPTHDPVVWGDSSWVKTSGGGDHFLDFIEQELIPYIEDNYPATSYRMLIGHSFGGLTAINTLFKRPELFQNYVAIDPSLWWDDQVMLGLADSIFAHGDLSGKSLFVSIANTMSAGMEYSQVREDTSESTLHIRSILHFVDEVDNGNDAGLDLEWKYYDDDDHGSVPLITEYDAMRYLFSWYRMDGLNAFFDRESTSTAQDLLDAINAHYEMVSEKFTYTVHPAENQVNGLGYQFMRNDMPEKAFVMFDLNVKNYPESANVYDSMGDYYVSQSDTVNAIKFFAKAVELWDNPVSSEKLESLKNGG